MAVLGMEKQEINKVKLYKMIDLFIRRFREISFIGIIIIITSAIVLYVFFDNNFLIRQWHIALARPGFLDSRQFAWASEAHALGYDPLIENPVNPKGHQLNYPRIWHVLFALGINESHTNIMGSIVVILFFMGIGIFWFSKKFDNLTYLILSMVVISPSVMLGVERSNIELIIFFILSLALTIGYRSTIGATTLIELASILKIYPVFGFVYFLKENKKRFWLFLLLASGIFILYAILILDDLIQVYKTTPQLVGSSFGINVWWRGLSHRRFLNLPISDDLKIFFKIISYIIALLILLLTFLFGILRKVGKDIIDNTHHIDAFRIGAAIYIGCFLLMNTHDYRLIFLIFTIPQIIEWSRKKIEGISSGTLITLVAMLFSLWSFFIMRFLGRKITFVMEEFSNWVILTGLLYLFFASLPEWVRKGIKNFFLLKKSKQQFDQMS
jgi:hypothetical protein